MRRMSVFPQPGTSLGNQGPTAYELQQEVENNTSELVSELANLSDRARTQAIRSLPMSYDERRRIRSRAISVKTSKNIFNIDCTQHVSRSFRRFGASVASARQWLVVWHGTLKEIGGRFGTSVLSYFLFLKWLLNFNVFSLIINFCFITIPQIVHAPNISNVTGFRGLELLTGVEIFLEECQILSTVYCNSREIKYYGSQWGVRFDNLPDTFLCVHQGKEMQVWNNLRGYFNQTVLFYGGYNGEVIVSEPPYNMQLAYFFTIAAYLVLCGVSLIYSMSRSFQKNFVLESGPVSGGAWRLLCSWDFSVVNEKAIQNNKNNLGTQLKESLSEKLQMKHTMSVSERMKYLSLHVLAWLLSLGLTVGSCAGIYFLGIDQLETSRPDHNANDLTVEASTLLLPVVVSLINLIVPLLYSLISIMERYSNPRAKIYIGITRNVVLKMSILGILCYYWLNSVPQKMACWESFVGQSVYRLLMIDFIFCLFGTFFGEFLRNVIGTTCVPSLGVPEFDIARNVLDLIYAQTLAWIGIYFSPLLPVMQVIKLFIIFYVKKFSLSMNCQPPKHTGRAAQMQTVFIALLFFPSFVGALSMVAYTVWSLKPSTYCGPFQGLQTPFHTILSWTVYIENFPGTHWVWWIFENMLRNELFYYLVTLIIFVITYFLWQITQGRKELIRTLRQQIVNEGKDKAFLLNRLQNTQKQGRQTESFRYQEFDQTLHVNPNWINTLPLDM